MGDLFDAAAMYDEDYLYFFAAPDDRSELASHGPVVPGADLPGAAAAELAWRLAELRPGMHVLDLACGHGELANRLAARGCQVTGLAARSRLGARTGRCGAERTVPRGGGPRRVNFVKRLFGFPELRDWLLAAGFTAVTGYGEGGRPLTADHKRMVIVAGLP